MIEMHQMAHARSARLARHAHQLEKGSDHELLREMIGYVAQRMMEMDVDSVVGAERIEGRENWRNGHREREWHTRSGTIALRIPKLRRGSYFPGFLKPRRSSEKALAAAEPFWTQFLRSLMRRGLRGVKLVISDAHEWLKAAVAKVLKASWQRCRVHFLRNALAYANKGQRQTVFALINTIFAQESAEAAHAQWRVVTDQLQSKFPKLATMMHEAEHEVLTFMDFPKEHRVKIHSTNVLERLQLSTPRPGTRPSRA